MARKNRRIRTGIIRARAIDRKLTYTTHLLFELVSGECARVGSLDVHPGRVEVCW